MDRSPRHHERECQADRRYHRPGDLDRAAGTGYAGTRTSTRDVGTERGTGDRDLRDDAAEHGDPEKDIHQTTSQNFSEESPRGLPSAAREIAGEN